MQDGTGSVLSKYLSCRTECILKDKEQNFNDAGRWVDQGSMFYNCLIISTSTTKLFIKICIGKSVRISTKILCGALSLCMLLGEGKNKI
jgi:hypothetical protein